MNGLQYWNTACEIKNVKEENGEGIVEAYVSMFDTKDSGDDVVRRGAFSRSIQSKKGKFPVLSHHDSRQQIGWGLLAMEDAKGLFTKSWYDIENNAKAREHFSLIKKAIEIEAQPGFSFGYRAIKWDRDPNDVNVRVLTEVKLFEWSPVTFPMHEGTYATGVKSLEEFETIDDGVALMLEAFKQKGYSDEEVLTALQSRAATPAKDPGLDAHSLVEQIQSLQNLIRAST